MLSGSGRCCHVKKEPSVMPWYHTGQRDCLCADCLLPAVSLPASLDFTTPCSMRVCVCVPGYDQPHGRLRLYWSHFGCLASGCLCFCRLCWFTSRSPSNSNMRSCCSGQPWLFTRYCVTEDCITAQPWASCSEKEH